MNETATPEAPEAIQPLPSTEAQAGDHNSQEPPQAANPSTPAPEPASTRGLNDAGLRFTAGDGVESWMVGKTAMEVAEIAKSLYDTVQRGTPSQPSQPQAQPNVNPAAPSGVVEPDPNLMYSDPGAYHRQMQAWTQAQIAAARGEVGAQLAPIARMARTQARSYKPHIWERYGPEIETTMASLNEASRADVDSWQRVVDYVAGLHVDELISAARAESASTDTGMLSSQGAAAPNGGGSLSPMRKLFKERPEVKEFYAEAGLEVADVISHGAKMGRAEAEFAEIVSRKVARRRAS